MFRVSETRKCGIVSPHARALSHACNYICESVSPPLLTHRSPPLTTDFQFHIWSKGQNASSPFCNYPVQSSSLTSDLEYHICKRNQTPAFCSAMIFISDSDLEYHICKRTQTPAFRSAIIHFDIIIDLISHVHSQEVNIQCTTQSSC